MMAVPVVLVEATPRRASDGAAVPVRLAGGGAAVPYFYGGQHWRAGIVALPKGTSSLDFDGEQLGGGGVANALEIQWAPGTNAALSEMSALYWTDAPITVRVGPEGDALPPIDTAGLVLDAPVEGGVLKIALADATTDLKRPLLVDRFAGTGGVEGPAEWEDKIKSRAWGRCFNVPGEMIDPANNIVCFGDPRRQWRSFVAVRDKGASASSDRLTLLEWQGSAEATFAALQGAAATAGGGVLCPSIACIKWWTEPGALHADVLGEIEGGYVETAPEIAARIIAARSTLAIGAGEVAAAAAARPAPFGWRVSDENTTAATEISTMLADVSLSWPIVNDAVVFRRWEWTAPVRSVRSDGVSRSEVKKPVATRKLGYMRNQSPMQRSELAAIVLASDVTYDDGTPIENLKPAQPGADVTGDNTSNDTENVGGRPVEDVLAAIDAQLLALADNARAILQNQLLDEDRKARMELLTHLDGVPVGTVINRVDTERQEGDQAIAETIALIGAKNGDGTAFIFDSDHVEVEPGKSLAQRFSDVAADASTDAGEQVTAAIQQLDQVIAGADGSSASSLTQLASQVGDAKSNIQILLQTVNGETSTVMLRLDANGKISGVLVDGEEQTAIWSVKRFVLADPDTNQEYFYVDTDGTVKMHNVEVDTLKVGAMDPEFLANQESTSGTSPQWSQKFPGGKIMKWGRYRATINREVSLSIVFTTPFPTACDTFVPIGQVASFSAYRDLWPQNVGEPTRYGATVQTQAATSDNMTLDGFDWVAFGR